MLTTADQILIDKKLINAAGNADSSLVEKLRVQGADVDARNDHIHFD